MPSISAAFLWEPWLAACSKLAYVGVNILLVLSSRREGGERGVTATMLVRICEMLLASLGYLFTQTECRGIGRSLLPSGRQTHFVESIIFSKTSG